MEQYESLGLVVFNGYLLLQDLTMLMELRGIAIHNVVAVFGLHLIAIISSIVLNSSNAFGRCCCRACLRVWCATRVSCRQFD
jgi:hypothetical protein